MSKVKSASDLGSLPTFEALRRWVSVYLQELSQIINGSLEFGVNIKGAFFDVSFEAANTEVRIAHGFGRIPQGYFVTNLNADVVIYNNGTLWDTTYVYLKSSGVADATLFIF